MTNIDGAGLTKDQTDLWRRRAYLLRMIVIVSIIQLVTLIVLVSFQATMDSNLWRIFLVIFILILGLSTAGIVVSWRESQQIQERLRDPLTNLLSQQYLEETLEREINRSQRHNLTIGIILLEIDRFNQISATYGDTVRDKILLKIAGFLQQGVRVYDMVCRTEGDKLVLVLGETSRGVTMNRADEIRALVNGISLDHNGKVIDGITCSAGVAIYPEHGTTVDALMKKAKNALDQAKSIGGDQAVID